MHDVFVSHASDDTEWTARLVENLEAEGLDVWWDGHLRGGVSIPETIATAQDSCRCTVVCWSKAALRPGRDWVRGEAERARSVERVISVCLDDTALPPPFNIRKAIDLSRWEGQRTDREFRSLVESVRAMPVAPSVPKASAGEAGAKKIALLMGTSACDGLPPLPAVTANVRELERVLSGPGCDFRVERVLDGNRQDIEDGLSGLDDVSAEATVLLYFAGHVVLTEDKELWLTARNSALNRRSTVVDLKVLDDYVGRCKARQIVLIFDACYGRIAQGRARAEISREEIETALMAHLGAGRSRTIIASRCHPKLGPDSWQQTHSHLSRGVLRAFGAELYKADSNRDSFVTVGELVTYLEKELGAQDPALAPSHWEVGTSSRDVALVGAGDRRPVLKPEQQQFVEMLRPEFEQGGVIPFFGDGVYGSGPLSFSHVAKALALRAGLRVDHQAAIGIATAAESLELQRDDRAAFLRELSAIIAEQSQNCEPPAAYELILDLRPPWFVVSVNYDDLLFRRLRDAGRPFVLVSHVLRSIEDVENLTPDEMREYRDPAGSLLVVRSPDHRLVQADPGRAAELCLPRDFVIEDDDCIVYQLLGAPYLNELDFSRKHKLDTVVATESDHIDFLAKLRALDTGVPRAFCSRFFRPKKLLFLEYNLDVWHYRLIGHLFRQTGRGRADAPVSFKKSPYVVRNVTSPVEERFWRRLSPDHTAINLAELVQVLRPARAAE